MGISCKPIGKLESMLRKVQNQRVHEQQIANKSKGKSDKKS